MKSAIISLLLIAVTFSVGNAFGQTEQWAGNCDITFSGSSTLHKFKGTVKAEPFIISISDLSDKAQANATGKVIVTASKMDTGNKKRDANMDNSMATKTFPEIAVDIGKLNAAATRPVTSGEILRPTVVPFTMNLKGKKQQKVGKVADWSYSDGNISFTVTFPVSLKASGITVPSVLGIVKVADVIQVSAKLNLKRK